VAITVHDYARRFNSLTKRAKKTALPVMRASTKEAKKEMRRDFKSRGLGRALWGRRRKKKSQRIPQLVIGRTSTKGRVGSTLVSQFDIKGMAATIDSGGQIDPHFIEQKTKPLSFRGTNQFAGLSIITSRVEHPGHIVSRRNVVDKNLRKVEPAYLRAMEKALVELATELVG